jgi:hypothetical protein
MPTMRVSPAVLLAPLVGLAACATSSRHEVLVRNEALFRAIGARDVATLTELTAPEFRFETADGQKGDRKTWLDGVAALPAIESITNEELHLREDGDRGAVLCGVQRAVVVVEGKRVVDTVAFCDRWERRDGRWVVTFAGPGAR